MTGASGLCAVIGGDRPVEGKIGVDLVREQRDAVLVGEVDQRTPHLGRIHRPGRVVRIDGDQRPRGRRDQAAGCDRDRAAIRAPDRSDRTPRSRRSSQHRGVERVGRHGTRTSSPGPASAVSASSMPSEVPEVSTTRSGETRHAAPAAFVGHRFPRRRQCRPTARSRCGRRERALDCVYQMRRRREAENDRVADIQVADARAAGLNPPGLGDDIPDRVIEAADAAGDRNRVVDRAAMAADLTANTGVRAFHQLSLYK